MLRIGRSFLSLPVALCKSKVRMSIGADARTSYGSGVMASGRRWRSAELFRRVGTRPTGASEKRCRPGALTGRKGIDLICGPEKTKGNMAMRIRYGAIGLLALVGQMTLGVGAEA